MRDEFGRERGLRIGDDFRRADLGIGAPGIAPVFDGVEEPFAADEAFAEQCGYAGVRGDGFEVAAERFDLADKAAAFVAFHHADDLGEFGLIPGFPGIRLLRWAG